MWFGPDGRGAIDKRLGRGVWLFIPFTATEEERCMSALMFVYTALPIKSKDV